MSTSDVLDPLTGSITSQPSLSGPENKEIEILEVPDTLPIDLRSKLSVCLINLRYKLPEVYNIINVINIYNIINVILHINLAVHVCSLFICLFLEHSSLSCCLS